MQVADTERPNLLEDLLREEHPIRWHAGELPTLAEYIGRFPGQDAAVRRAWDAEPKEYGVRYALVEKLGAGGFGTVFRARDTKMGREVALKVLNSNRLSSPQAVRRFEQEMQTLARLELEGVVQVHDYGQFENGQPYVVMQLLSGGSLEDLIRSHPSGVQPREAAQLMQRVADSLHRLHERGKGRQALIHCDLKPANILLDDEGGPRIADFGLAGAAGELLRAQASPGAAHLRFSRTIAMGAGPSWQP